MIFLQNAWSPYYAGGIWPRKSWERALWRSPTGRRLSKFIEAFEGDIYVDETTPIVGAKPNSVVPPDFKHMRRVVEENKPDLVVACGKQAQKAVRVIWTGFILDLPHPAYRQTSNKDFANAALLMNERFSNEC